MISSNNTETAVKPSAGYQTDFQRANQIEHILPDKPVVVVEPQKSWVPLNLRDLWQYRDLLYILAMRDIKVRYKQTLLGAAWAIIQPLFTTLIFTIFFGNIAGITSGSNIPYPLFAFAGLLPWTFFSNAVNSSGNSLVGNSNLITKVYFPRMIIPMAAVASGFVDFLIAFGIFVIMMLYYQVGFTVNLLMLPFLVLITALLAIGVGMWTSALNVKYRDVRHALPFLIQLMMFASGIVARVPDNWRFILRFNPLVGLIEAYRAAFFGTPFAWRSLGFTTFVTLAVLIYAAYSFRRMEKSFADLV